MHQRARLQRVAGALVFEEACSDLAEFGIDGLGQALSGLGVALGPAVQPLGDLRRSAHVFHDTRRLDSSLSTPEDGMKQIRFAFCLAILGAGALSAEWLHQPTPAVPRLPDGRPNFTAPAARTSGGHPDLSGMWRIFPNPSAADLMQQLRPEEVQPWALALRQQRVERFEGVTTGCLPLGPVQDTGTASFGEGAKFIQTPGEIVILYPDLTYRQVFLDGRKLERDPNPSWMGYSVGHWDGNTLVVESNGYNNRTWLDFVGLPHSEGLRVTERFQRVSFGMMKLSMTMEDPAVFSRPVQLDTMMQTIVDTEMLEYVCAENEKDGAHLTG